MEIFTLRFGRLVSSVIFKWRQKVSDLDRREFILNIQVKFRDRLDKGEKLHLLNKIKKTFFIPLI